MKALILRLLSIFYPLVKKLMPFKVFAYLSLGAINTLLNIGLFIILFQIFKASQFSVEIATVLSFGVTVLTGFWFSKQIVFSDSKEEMVNQKTQFVKYFLVSIQGQFSDYLITKGLIIFFIVPPTIAYVVSTAIMLIVNYFLQKYFTFRKRKLKVSRL